MVSQHVILAHVPPSLPTETSSLMVMLPLDPLTIAFLERGRRLVQHLLATEPGFHNLSLSLPLPMQLFISRDESDQELDFTITDYYIVDDTDANCEDYRPVPLTHSDTRVYFDEYGFWLYGFDEIRDYNSTDIAYIDVF